MSLSAARAPASVQVPRATLVKVALVAVAAAGTIAISTLPLGADPGSTPAPVVLGIGWVLFLAATSRWRRTADRAVRSDVLTLFWVKGLLATALYAVWYMLIEREVQAGNILSLGIDVFRLEDISNDLVEAGALGYPAEHPPLEQLGFPIITAAMYWLFGRSLFLITILNLVTSTLLAVETYRIGRLFLSEKAARIGLWLAALMPDFVIYTFLGYKDMLVVYLLILSFRLFVTTENLATVLRRLPIVGAITYAIVELRSAALPILVIFAIVSALLRDKGGARNRPWVKWGLVSGTALLVLMSAFLARSTGVENVLAQLPTRGTFELQEQASTLAFTDSAESSLALKTFWNYQPALAFLIPIRAALVLIVPSPFLFSNLVLGLQSIAVWVMAAALPLALWAARDFWRARRREPEPWRALVAPLVLLLLSLATVEPILESRHRLIVMPFLALVTAHGLAHWQYSRMSFLYAAPVAILLIGSYAVFKVALG